MHSQVLPAHLVGRCLKGRHPNSSSSSFLFSASSPACTTTGSRWHRRCRTGKRTKGAFVTLIPLKLQPHFLAGEMAAQTRGRSALAMEIEGLSGVRIGVPAVPVESCHPVSPPHSPRPPACSLLPSPSRLRFLPCSSYMELRNLLLMRLSAAKSR